MVKLIVISLICESVWETLKMTWQNNKYATIDRIGALILSLIVSIACGLDILKLADIESNVPLLGMFLCGILISRGSNFIHDFIKSISNINQITKKD